MTTARPPRFEIDAYVHVRHGRTHMLWQVVGLDTRDGDPEHAYKLRAVSNVSRIRYARESDLEPAQRPAAL